MSRLKQAVRTVREWSRAPEGEWGKDGRFRDALRVIPLAAWIVAVLVWAGITIFIWMIPLQHEPGMRDWLVWQKVLFAGLVPLVASVYVLLVGYVNGDARRRGMRRVMWTLLALFVPNAIGIILYFLLRDPLPAPCHSCGVLARGAFAFCPQCGAALSTACPQCRRPVERSWANCAYCGAKLSAESSHAA